MNQDIFPHRLRPRKLKQRCIAQALHRYVVTPAFGPWSPDDFSRLVPEGNYLAVTYESIVQQPEQFVIAMEKFMGKAEPYASDRTRIRRSQVHVIGNRMRESADRVLDYSNTWRGKMPQSVEDKADEAVKQDSWLRSLY